MSAYLQTILVTAALSQMLLVLAAELWGEHTQKLLRLVCGTVLLLTLFSPLQETAEGICNAVSQLLIIADVNTTQEDSADQTGTIMEITVTGIAEKWFAYLTENYGLNRSQIYLVFQTDENLHILEAEITLHDCPYALRRKIENEMTEQAEFPVTVKGE